MSYILEGLKKLEQKRIQEEKLPYSFTFQTEDQVRAPKLPVWLYLLVAALILNAGVIIWWIAPWRPSEDRNLTDQSGPRKTGPAASGESGIAQKRQAQAKPLPAKEPIRKKATGISSTDVSNTETKKVLPSAAKETQASGQSSSADPAASEKSKPPVNGRTMKLSELPADIKKGLPDLKVSAHFYSTDKQARFARINDRILHEGESLIDGLKVEEINPGGTILNYRGHRFQIGINENR